MDIGIIKEWAKELGFSQVGICSTAAFEQQKLLVESQPEMKERRQLRYSPQEDYPLAKALLVLLYPYLPAQMPEEPHQVFVDSYYYASNQAYHAAIQLEKRIQEVGYMAKANVSYPAKTCAMRAGLGCIGDHGLLITKAHGTRVVICLLATDAVEAEKPNQPESFSCLHCGKCETACPSGAIGQGEMQHPERCLRNFMMEGIVVPEELRSPMGKSLIGCDRCQRVCPLQPRMGEERSNDFYLQDFLQCDEQRFKASVARLAELIGRNAARPQRIRAQAALIAGNIKENAEEVLRIWAQSDHEAVRIHAEWALEQLAEHDTGA